MNTMKAITVFTPSFNRAGLLPRCYESMRKQTNKNFIWMIVDDGSTDETRQLVEKWMDEEKDVEIQYYYKENGGLHTAYNEAISHIVTPLSVCIDSDDWMPDNAIDKILSHWSVEGSSEYAGIVGLDCFRNGEIIGEKFPDQHSINLIDLLTKKYPIKNGDRTCVVRTELYKKYAPMKVFPGEKNFNPHYMHLQISMEYDFLVLNENLHFVEYQPGGMSNSMLRQYKSSPNSFAETRLLYLSFPDTDVRFQFKNSIHLVSSGILAGNLKGLMIRSPHRFLMMLSIPFGWILSRYIKYRA